MWFNPIDLELNDMFLTNLNEEIVACILLPGQTVRFFNVTLLEIYR